MIQLKRVYDPPAPQDGKRFLVERLWPRGMKKESLALDAWLKEVAPSDALRRWFGHDPARWHQFVDCYRTELEQNPATWTPLLEAAQQGNVTLLYSAHDTEHNNALVLRDYLHDRLGRPQPY